MGSVLSVLLGRRDSKDQVNGMVERKSMANSKNEYVPVLIVGGGPTGLLLSYLLSRLGGMFAM